MTSPFDSFVTAAPEDLLPKNSGGNQSGAQLGDSQPDLDSSAGGGSDLMSLAQKYGAPVDVVMGLKATEGSAPTAVSPAGARGELQVTAPAWKDYGIPGVAFKDATNDQLNEAAVRKIAADFRWSGGDQLKTAAAYQAGRGGAALWASGQGASRGDGNLSIDGYVNRFKQKLAGVSDIAQQFRAQRLADQQAAQPQYDIDRRNDDTAYLTSGGLRVNDAREKGPTVGDYLKNFGAAVIGTSGDVVRGAGEMAAWAANEITGTQDYEGKNPLNGVADKIRDTMTPGGKAARDDANIEGDVFKALQGDTSGVRLPTSLSGYLMMAADGLGSLVPMAASTMLTGGAAPIAGAVVGGLMTAGGAAGDVRDSVRKMLSTASHDDLMKSIPIYRDAFNQTGDQRYARNAVENNAALFAGALSGIAGAVGGGIEGKLLHDLIVHKGIPAMIGNLSERGLIRTAVGGVAGGAGESIQETSEKVGQNAGENIALGKSAMDDVTRNTLGDAIGGAVVGGPTGGFGGAVSRHGNNNAHTPAVPANSPLSRAAATSNPDLTAPPGVDATQAQPSATAGATAGATQADAPTADATQAGAAPAQQAPFAGTPYETMFAEVDARLNDRNFLRSLDPADRDELLYAYNVARNPNVRPDLRTQAVNDTWDFINRKTSMGRQVAPFNAPQEGGALAPVQSDQGAAQPAQQGTSIVPAGQPTQGGDANVIDGHARLVPVQRDMRDATAPSNNALGFTPVKLPPPQNKQEHAHYEQEYADLLKVDQIDKNLKSLQDQAQQLQAAAAQNQQNAGRLQEIQQAIAANRAETTRQDRLRILSDVLAEPSVQNHGARFQADLRRAGYRDTNVTNEESSKIERFLGIRDALNAAPEIEPSAPNELDPYKPAKPANAAANPPAQVADRRARVRDAIQSGATTLEQGQGGAVLRNPTTGAVHPLSRAEQAIARAELARKADHGANQAATSELNDKPQPTDAQKKAGDYDKGHINFQGLNVAIENPKGSVRSGTDENGKPWQSTMTAHYGYIEGTKGADGDGIDAFVGPNAASRRAFIVDQVNPATGKFDEHKVMLGYNTAEEAAAAYKSNYDADWQGMGHITGLDMDAFKQWLNEADHTKPAATQPETPAQKARAKAAEKKRTGAQVARERLKRENPFLAFIGEFGINPADRADIGQEKGQRAVPGFGFVFRKSAPRLDELAMLAKESGFLSDDDIDNPADTGGTRKLADMIQRALDGNSIERAPEDAVDAAVQRRDADYQEYLQQQQESERDGAAERDAILYAEKGAFDVIDDADIPFDLTTTDDPATLTDHEIDRLFGIPAQSGGSIQEDSASSESARASDSATQATASDGSGKNEGLSLSSYSADEIRAKQDKQDTEARAEVKAKRDADEQDRREREQKELSDRRRQDASAENFELGQDPMESLSGQGDIFSAPASPAQKLDTHLAAAQERVDQLRKLQKDAEKNGNAWVYDRAVADAEKALQSFQQASDNLAQRDTAVENRPVSENTAPKEGTNHDERTGAAGDPALDGVPAAENEGTQEGGAAAIRGREGSGSRAGGDAGVDAGRVPAARSGRSGDEGVHPAAAREDARRRAGADRRGSAIDGRDVGGNEGHAGSVQRSEREVTPPAPAIPSKDFTITDETHLGEGGIIRKFSDNLGAIQTLKKIEAEGRRATAEEQAVLARYVGWGGLQAAFPRANGSFPKGWDKRGRALKDLLTKEEYDAALASTRNAHYTSRPVVEGMWNGVQRLGVRSGISLEPSMGVGNFLGLAPDTLRNNLHFVGVELDSLTGRMAQMLYPNAVVHAGVGFQDFTFNPNQSYDLVIGNPPFGQESLYDPNYKHLNGQSIHNYFFMKSLDSLRPNGVMAMVVSRYLMDAKDASARKYMAERARLLGAIRLPDSAFQENANTEVVTDILFLQKLPESEYGTADKAWTETGEIADPLGGDPITINRYFVSNPQMMLGRMERSGEMHQQNDVTLAAHEGRDIRDDLASAIDRLPEGIVHEQTGGEAAEKQFKAMREAMDQNLDAREDGQFIKGPDGRMQMVERGEDGIPRTISITPDTPWSSSLQPDGNGGYTRTTRIDGKTVTETFKSDADVPARLRLGDKKFTRLKAMMNLRDLLRRQISLEQAGSDAEAMESNRAKLKEGYQSFVKQHGFLNSDANANLFASDPDAPLLAALELSYDPGVSPAKAKSSGVPQRAPSAKPAPIMERRVIEPYRSPDKAESHKDALVISLAETGKVDINRMASLMDSSPDEVIRVLHDEAQEPFIFNDPETGGWETRDSYLSGQVKRKLRAAREAGLEKNVAELEKVQPEDIPAGEISVRLGSVWVPTDVYQSYIKHLLGDDATPVVSMRKYDSKFFVHGLERVAASARATETWGTKRMPADALIQTLLNSQSPTIYDHYRDEKGNDRRVINEEATAEAMNKAREIAADFQDWVYADGDRRERLARVYNDTYNTLLNRQYDGQHLTLPGKVPDAIIQMRRHQKNAVWRIIQSRFTLLDHTVGAGKTFTAQASAMELRRMGLARKPMAVVPNHMVQQFAADMYRLYPGAKVLAAGKKDFERKNRRRLFGRIATGDWDIVIVPHSSFGFIDISPKQSIEYLSKDINTVQEAIDSAIADEGKGARSVKDIQRTKVKLEEKMKKLLDKPADKMLSFEEMGIDHMFVDEAQEFKNLYYHTRLQNVLGLGTKDGSKRALNLYMKTRVLTDGLTGRGGITFMTGTPISNSIVEMYTLMRYLASGALHDAGIDHFDAWHKQFAEARTQMEMNEAGGLVEKTRMASFSNMPELMKMYYEFADAVTLDDIKRWYAEDNNGASFPVPQVEGGKRNNIVVQPTPLQEQILMSVVNDFAGLKQIKDPRERNKARLRLMDRARKVSLDARAVDPSLPAEAGGKLSEVVKNALGLYHQWDSDKGTQLIFLDRSVPNSKSGQKVLTEYDALHDKLTNASDEDERDEILDKLSQYDMSEIQALRESASGGWNAYDEIKRQLVAAGVPEHEIRFIQEANTDQQKQDIFDAVNAGDVRFLLGSSQRMGAGTNVQQRLVGLHHVDVTWRPSDIEQREGRIERQGNHLLAKYGDDKFKVAIRAYATERTYDAKMWSLVEAKMRFINSLRHFDGQREIHIDDEDSENMAEMAALASGDPQMLERVRLEAELNKLTMLRRSFNRRQNSLDDQIRQAQKSIDTIPGKIGLYEQDESKARSALQEARDDASKRRITVDGDEFSSVADALAAINTLIESQQGDNPKARYSVRVNGKTMTNRDSITAEVWSSLGDAKPFKATIDGKNYISRMEAGRAMAEKVNDLRRKGADQYHEAEIGTYLGMPLSIFTEGNQYGISLEGKARNYSDTTFVPESGQANAQAIQSMLNDIVLQATGNVAHLNRQLDNAKRDLPELKNQSGKAFPQEAEYQAKNNRLSDLTKILANKSDKAPEKQNSALDEEVRDAGVGGVNWSVGGSNPTVGKAGVSLSEAEGIINRIMRSFPDHRRARVVAVDSFSDLPPAMQEAYRREHGEDASDAKGGHHHGLIYLVRENHATTADYEETLLHELIGHAGMRELFGQRWTDEMNSIFDALDGIKGIDAVFGRQGYETGRHGRMMEYARGISQKLDRNGNPIPEAISRALLVEEMFAHMAEKSQTLKARALAMIGRFRQWLRAHAFKNLAANTDADLFYTLAQARDALKNQPDPSGGPGGGRRPTSFRAGSEDVAGDNIMFRAGAGDREAMASLRDHMRQSIADNFNTQRTFNWWHKTVGTQYHKAQIDSHFGKVFNLAQHYIDDVARYASEAADMATGLLPKMETARDAAKGLFSIRQDSADAKAISAPIFEGTLNDKVWTDEELRSKYGLNEKQIGLYREFRAAADKSLDDLAKSEMGRLARASGIPLAPATMTMREAAAFYQEHYGADLEAARTNLNDLRQQQATERKTLEQAAQDEAGGADERRRFARLQSEMDARHAIEVAEAKARVTELEQLHQGFIEKANKIDDLKRKGYAPLTRFGKYTVDVFLEDKDGNPVKDGSGEEIRPFFGMFETQAEANRAARALQEEYPSFTVKQGVMSQNAHQLYRGVTPETLEVLAHAMNADQDEAFQKYLKTAVSNRSALKRLIERKGIRGFSEDPVRVLASFLTSNARAAAANDNMGDMLKAASDIPREKGDVRDEAANLIGYLQNPAEEASKLRGMLFVQFLGGSVASALVNMTQTFTMTYPYLHQFGGKTALILGDAMRMSAKLMVNKDAQVGDEALRDALRRAAEEGITNPHEIHMLHAESNRTSAFQNNRFSRNLTKMFGSFFSLAEQYNRDTAFIAAFKVAQARGMEGDAAYQFAKKAVTETQGLYSKANRPNWARGAVGATLFTFKQYSVGYLEFLVRLPAKQRAIALGILMLAAGAQGLPGADDLDDVIDTLAQSLGYSFGTRQAKRDFLTKLLGKDAAGYIQYGVSHGLPIDVAGRMSVGNLIPGTGLLKRSSTDKTNDVAEFFGPAGALGQNMLKAFESAQSGEFSDPANIAGAAASLLPKSMQDAYKGWDMLQTGTYKDTKGRRVADVTPLDAAIKAVGFQPAHLAEDSRLRQDLNQTISLNKAVQTQITERWAEGVAAKDPAKIAQARAAVADWNATNPDSPISVKFSTVQSRVRQMQLSADERLAKAAPASMRAQVRGALTEREQPATNE